MQSFNNSFNSNRFFGEIPPEIFMRKEKEKSDLKKVGFYTGVAILGNILAQNAMLVFLQAFNLTDKYLNDGVFSTGLDIIFTVVSLLLPFMLVGRKMNEYSSVERVFYLGGPYRNSLMLPAVVAGVGCCMGANIVTNYISVIFNNFGYEPSDLDFNLPDGAGGFVLSMFRMAIIAGLVEEIAMRGYTLGNLRFYGDKFAIIMSSIVFAVIHGNFTQIPFALISAFGLGYFSVKTGTMWTGVIIHIINNAISVSLYYLTDLIGEQSSLWLQLLIIYGFIGLGIVSLIYFNSKTRDIPLSNGNSILDSSEKTKAYFSSVPMIISIAYFIIISILSITKI